MMGFGAAVTTCMRKFVTFSGRAPRAEYWWFFLFTSIISVVFEFINANLAAVVNLVFVLPTLAVSWRRLHDLGKSGMWNLAPLLGVIPLGIGIAAGVSFFLYAGGAIAIVLGLYVFYLTIQSGEIGANEFGEDPYGGPSYDASVFD